MSNQIINKEIITVGVGDFKVGKINCKIKTFLGCCIGICLYEKKKKIGGLLHIMLPTAPRKKIEKPAKYVDTGIKEIFRVFEKKYGVNANTLVGKIFGGAKMIQGSDQDIGQKNVEKARKILKKNKIKILKEKVGGTKGYRIEFDILTGSVRCQVFGEKEEIF